MLVKKIEFSKKAQNGIQMMYDNVLQMLVIAKDAFINLNKGGLCELADLENSVDGMKKELIASHFSRLAEGNCSIEVSPYYSSAILGIERVADHLVNIGYSIVNPVGTLEEN